MTDQLMDTATPTPERLGEAMRAAHLVPLWESPTAHKTEVEREAPHLWAWSELGPIMAEVCTIASPSVVERRVLSLVNPKSKDPEDEATCGVISAAIQSLLPGENARPHRHSMNALRFVVEGSGAETVVDGKRCAMNPGDLIITPAWCWHEHISNGDERTTWIDVLDVALHLALGTDEFQPGPITSLPPQLADEAYSVANIVPDFDVERRPHSPVFRYGYDDVVRALREAPVGSDGARRVRYVNPLTGGQAMAFLDCTMVEIGTQHTKPRGSTASTVCVVADGSGESVIDGHTVRWQQHDVFTIPQWAMASHRADADSARVFMVSNRDVYERLGLLHEIGGDES